MIVDIGQSYYQMLQKTLYQKKVNIAFQNCHSFFLMVYNHEILKSYNHEYRLGK